MMKNLTLFLAAFSLVLTACTSNLKPEKLYGKWKYTRVQNPHAVPPDSLKQYELDEQQPYIVFGKGNTVEINWGGKVLSKGTFTTNGGNIIIQDKLPDGKTREFPFYVSKLDDKQIIFESMGESGSKVTAVKVAD